MLPTILSIGQQLKPMNDSTATITKDEVKYVTQKFIDLETCEQIHVKDVEKISVLERIIADKLQLIGLKDEEIDLLKRKLEIITPAWWNKFSWGFAVGVIVVLLPIIL